MTQPQPISAQSGNPVSGAFYGTLAFLIWGLGVPLYLKTVSEIPPVEVLAFRVVWSLVFVGSLVAILRRGRVVAAALRSRRLLGLLTLSSLLIAGNWVVYIWAFTVDRVIEASMGYFISPLINIILAVAVLGERLNTVQWLAVALAAAGVLYMLAAQQTLPWIALWLSVTFGFYSLIRKQVRVDSISGLFVELIVLAPLAILYLAYLWRIGGAVGATLGWEMDALLALGGVVTALPLILYVLASKNMNLSALGMLQYFSPSLTLLLAVFAFGETFTTDHAITFGLIWAALLLSAVEAPIRRWRVARQSGEA